MKMPAFVRKTAQAAPVRMFGERQPLAPETTSRASIIGRVDVRFAAHLPEAAQRIVRDIAEELEEVIGTGDALNSRREAIREAKGFAESRIYELQSPMNSYAKQSGPEIANQQKIVAECQADFQRLEGRMAEVNAKSRVLSQLIESARDLVRRAGREKPITVFSGPVPQLRKNETAANAVEMRQRRSRELDADYQRKRVSPMPSAEVKADKIAVIHALAKRGTPNLFNAIETGGEIEWPTTFVQLPDGSVATVHDALGFQCWLHRDAVIAGIEREIEAMADDENALTAVERDQQLTQIKRDKLATEREEVAFIRVANSQGAHIPYRGDTDCRALLGLSDDMPAPRND